ncbi:MAG TPA: thioredoxin domain-containing protein [Anaerolineae bacterium]
MSKKKTKRRSRGSGSEVFIIIGLGAVIIVIGLIALGGGLQPPVSAESLTRCNGKPCPSKGNPDAPVLMVELSDYACSHCRNYSLQVEPIIDQEYVQTGKVRYVSHIYALRPQTESASAAAMCADEQSKYWEFHHTAFANQRTDRYPGRDDFLAWGQQIGLNMDAFAQCIDSNRYVQDVQFSAAEGERAGVTGTPSFYIDGRFIVGEISVAQARAALDAALAGR